MLSKFEIRFHSRTSTKAERAGTTVNELEGPGRR